MAADLEKAINRLHKGIRVEGGPSIFFSQSTVTRRSIHGCESSGRWQAGKFLCGPFHPSGGPTIGGGWSRPPMRQGCGNFSPVSPAKKPSLQVSIFPFSMISWAVLRTAGEVRLRRRPNFFLPTDLPRRGKAIGTRGRMVAALSFLSPLCHWHCPASRPRPNCPPCSSRDGIGPTQCVSPLSPTSRVPYRTRCPSLSPRPSRLDRTAILHFRAGCSGLAMCDDSRSCRPSLFPASLSVV